MDSAEQLLNNLSENNVDALVDTNMGLVYDVAKVFTKNPSIDFDELVSAGSLALAKAAEQFDPANGATFSNYAASSIRNAMRRVAKETARNKSRTPVSMDDPYNRGGNEGDDRTFGDTVVDPSATSAGQEQDRESALDVLSQVIAELSPREQSVINALKHGSTYQQISTDLGVSRPRAFQIAAKALKALEKKLLARGYRGFNGSSLTAESVTEAEITMALARIGRELGEVVEAKEPTAQEIVDSMIG